MNIIHLIRDFKDSGIDISLYGEDLKISVEGDMPAEDVLQKLRASKAAIIDFLKKVQSGTSTDIPVTPKQESYPLSSSQRRLWILSQFEESSMAYNMPGVYIFEGELNVAALSHGFEKLVARHESLRTVFRQDEEGELRQLILHPGETGFEVLSADLRQEEDRDGIVRRCVQAEITTPFDLSDGPLLRAALYQVADNKWVFTYTMHHIISDGWSMRILMKELLLYYNAYVKGEEVAIAPLRIHYKDYTIWQQQQLSGQQLQYHRNYWLEQFKGELPILALPGDRPRPAVKTHNGGLVHVSVDRNVARNFKGMVREQGGSLFMGLLAAVNTLLYRYTGQEDIIIGSPVAGREHTDLEDQIGFYVNTLALRAQFKGNKSFRDLLDHIREVTLGAYEHQVYPFDDLVDQLNLQRDMSRNALFDVMVALQNTKISSRDEQRSLAGINVAGYQSSGEVISKFDLTFNFAEQGESLLLDIEYNSDIYEKSTMERLGTHLGQLLAAIAAAPSIPLNRLDYVSAAEKEQLLFAFNDTTHDYPSDKTLVALFEEQVARTPEQVALVFNGTSFTYRELNERANQLGAYLREQYHIRPDDLVGVQLQRSEQMIIALLGVLKSGGAYVPVDPGHPQERIDYMLQDSGCKTLLDAGAMERFTAVADNYSREDLPLVNQPTDLVYVIYTSGSTGRPKGCMLEHRGVINRIEWMWSHYGFRSDDIILQKTTFTFDVSVWELWMPLCWGTRMVLCEQDDIGSPDRIVALINREGVTCLHFVPSMLQAFLSSVEDRSDLAEQLQSLRRVITSGEALPVETVNSWYDRVDVPIHNLYGPTEASVDVTYYATKRGDRRIPIGRPIWNTSMYVLGSDDQLVPVGVAGEICIGGTGLARGYLNKPELTAEKFVADPFRAGERIYRTGDLGRWLADGNIEYLGRKDDQVKIRGYRIELGEIESALQGHESVTAAAVIARVVGSGEKELVAYVVGGEALQASVLRAYLGKTLPAYMVPGYYVQLEALPLSPNGKLDRKRLPSPEGMGLPGGHEYVAPRSATEKQLAEIWESILGKQQIGIKDNFFELGGHSLKATRLASQVYKTFEAKISLKDLFAVPVLEEQAAFIQRAKKTAFVEISTVPVQEHYPLSSSQYRLWVLCRMEEANISYNMSGSYFFEGQLDFEALAAAFNTMIARHEVLRTVFRELENGEVRQYVLPVEESGFSIKYLDLREEADNEAVIRRLVKEDMTTAFDLANGPLLRVGLYQPADNKWVFSHVIHHIISDAWSMDILVGELLLFYHMHRNRRENPLSPLRIQYKDYASWQQEQVNGNTLDDQKAYWLKQFEGELPVLQLPADKIRPALKTYNAGSIKRRINTKLTGELKSLCQETGSTLFMGLLATINTLLYRYTGQDDIIVGSPVAGRAHANLEDQIGFYVNTLALRTRFEGTGTYRQLLENVKQVTLDAYDNQLYPFDKLVDALNLKRDISRSPLFDVMLVLKQPNNIEESASQDDMRIGAYEGEEHLTVKVDLTFDVFDTGNELYIRVGYNNDIYARNSMERLADHLEQLLAVAAASPDMPLNRLDYLSPAEKEQLLLTFNNTVYDRPADKTLMTLFEEQVVRTPDQVALMFNGNSFTYRELNERANQLGRYLRQQYRVGPNDLVGVRMRRSEQMIISLLGVLKSGAAYLPVDPDYPQERIDYMLEDSNCKMLLDAASLKHFSTVADNYSRENLAMVNQPADLVYVIYTSGSTGSPKGVMIENGNLVNYLIAINDVYRLKGDERILQTSNFSFDASVEQIFLSLVSGATLYVITADLLIDDVALNAFIQENAITHLHAVPAILDKIAVEYSASLRRIISAGEDCPSSLLNRWHSRVNFYNKYGPTEATISSVIFQADRQMPMLSKVPIGRPVSNKIYIVDELGALVPAGVTGELCISGAGVARGYLNKPELTAEKFVLNPYKAGERIYRTGDLARWLADGSIEYLGRKDDQVKTRGYRIELGEIKNALMACNGVRSAVVAAKTNAYGEKELIAYLVGSGGLNVAGIRSQLSKTLPVFMVPAYYVQLESLPLSPNGKLDMKKLPVREGLAMTTDTTYEAPRNETEHVLVKIWEEVLGREGIGIRDNVFELGGNSINLIRLNMGINKAFGRNEPLKTMFHLPTVAEMAEYLESGATTETTSIVNVNTIPALAADSPAGISYNMAGYFSGWSSLEDPMVLYVEYPEINIDALRLAVNRLVQRHEILRTVFVADNDSIFMQVLSAAEWQVDVSEHPVKMTAEMCAEFIAEEHRREFDLYKGPLLFVNVLRLEKGMSLVVLNMHHAISDGFSSGILKQELMQLYAGATGRNEADILPLPFQYRDFARWQQSFVQSAEGEKHKQYWQQRLNECLPEVRFSAREKIVHTKQNGICSNLLIEGFLLEDLDAFAKENKVTRTVFLLGVLNIVLNRLTNQADITILTRLSGRHHKYYGDMDVTGLIGFFVNTLLIRSRIDSNTPVPAYFRELQEDFLDDLGFSAYPFGKLINELPGISPAAFLGSTVVYNYHNYDYLRDVTYREEPGLAENHHRPTIQTALVLHVKEFGNCLLLEFIGSENVFSENDLLHITSLYHSLLEQVLYERRSLYNVSKENLPCAEY
ncbi:non-ribosomal peptide synthetase [Chitinophaga tropicalis]|uniref:Amino acid adenylation domain-containing protein n=1 Tax=Chitinophaga tropicalis TaxID=2683588 RepID=A0A7K1UAL9_9BACT|nr:non-ribosomal peptide synthetase [Chitinophaga tropicalis]MVT11424.1 amino acid adenylation domain-containing protein [Chitinophaga tropicalis]